MTTPQVPDQPVLTGKVIPPPGSEGFDPETPTPEAPYGWTYDRKTKVYRPKKLPGAPKKDGQAEDTPPGPSDTPSLDDLKARAGRGKASDDRSPEAGKTAKAKKSRELTDVPPFRAGPIATGMNKLYARVGRIVRTFDPGVGAAIIATTAKESESETTVGEAWEELARTNPRVRKALYRLIEGGAWGSLLMAHAPILVALLMKPGLINRLPLGKLIMAYFDDADKADAAPGSVGEALGDLSEDDLAAVGAMAQNLMGSFFQAGQARAGNGTGRPA